MALAIAAISPPSDLKCSDDRDLFDRGPDSTASDPAASAGTSLPRRGLARENPFRRGELTFYSDLGKPGRRICDFFLGVEMTRPTRSLFGSAAFFYADMHPTKPLAPRVDILFPDLYYCNRTIGQMGDVRPLLT